MNINTLGETVEDGTTVFDKHVGFGDQTLFDDDDDDGENSGGEFAPVRDPFQKHNEHFPGLEELREARLKNWQEFEFVQPDLDKDLYDDEPDEDDGGNYGFGECVDRGNQISIFGEDANSMQYVAVGVAGGDEIAGIEEPGKEKEKDDGTMRTGETTDEHLERKSLIRTCRKENKKLRADLVGEAQPGTDEYIKRVKRYKHAALSAVNDAIINGDPNKLPTAVVLGIRWHEGLQDQFMDMHHRYGNLDQLGNMIALFHDVQYTLYNFARYEKFSKLVDLVSKSSLKWDEGMRPALVLAGMKSCGKTYIMSAFERQMFPGVYNTVTHQTAMAQTSGIDSDLMVTNIDEAPPDMTGGGVGRGAAEIEASRGNAIQKSLMTNKRCVTRTLRMVDGERKLVQYCSSNIGTYIIATNLQLAEESNPTIARFIVVMVENDPDMEKRVRQLQETELEPIKQKEIERRQLINFYIMLVEIYIYTGVIRDVQMDAFVMYQQRYCENMEEHGFYLKDPKRVVHLHELARTLTVEYAVCMALFSEISYDARSGPTEDQYVRFFDNADYFVGLIEAHLVCLRSIAIYTFSLCKMLWANPLESVLLTAARKHTIQDARHVFDKSCYINQTDAEQDNADWERGGTLGGNEVFDSSYQNVPDEAKFDSTSASTSADSRVSRDAEEISAADVDRLLDIVKMSGEDDSDKSLEKTLAVPRKAADDDDEDEDDDDTLMSQIDEQGAAQAKLVDRTLRESKKRKFEDLYDTDSQLNANDQSNASSSADTRVDEDTSLNIPFRVTYKDGPDAPVLCPNYVEIRPSGGLSVHNVCNTLLQHCGASRPSAKNLATVLRNMSQQEIVCPIYEFDPVARCVKRGRGKTRIPVVKIEQNRTLLDPKRSEGHGNRVYIALHTLLNSHSIDLACMTSIRDLGFDNSTPGRFIVNIPMRSTRYKTKGGKLITMDGIQRTVNVLPRPGVPFVFVKSSQFTNRMADLFASQSRRYKVGGPTSISPSMLLSQAALHVIIEPEIAAIQRHFLHCGVPRLGNLSLFTAPIVLQQTIARIRSSNERLRNMKFYNYPKSLMRERYSRFLQEDTVKSKDHVLLSQLAPVTDILGGGKDNKIDIMPPECLKIMTMEQIRNMFFSYRDIIGAAVAKKLHEQPLKMLKFILAAKYTEPHAMLKNLSDAGFDTARIMLLDEYKKQRAESLAKANEPTAMLTDDPTIVGNMHASMQMAVQSNKKRRLHKSKRGRDELSAERSNEQRALAEGQPLARHAIAIETSRNEFFEQVSLAADADNFVCKIDDDAEIDLTAVERLRQSGVIEHHTGGDRGLVRAGELDDVGANTGAFRLPFNYKVSGQHVNAMRDAFNSLPPVQGQIVPESFGESGSAGAGGAGPDDSATTFYGRVTGERRF